MATISYLVVWLALNCACMEIYAIHFLPTNVHRNTNRRHYEFLKEINDLEIPISNSNHVAKLKPITTNLAATKEQQMQIDALVNNIIGLDYGQMQDYKQAEPELTPQADDDVFSGSGPATRQVGPAGEESSQSNDLDNLYYSYDSSGAGAASLQANMASGFQNNNNNNNNNKPTLNRLGGISGCKPNLVGTSGYKISCTDKLDRLLHAAYVRITSNFEKMVDQLRNDAKTIYERRLSEANKPTNSLASHHQHQEQQHQTQHTDGNGDLQHQHQ